MKQNSCLEVFKPSKYGYSEVLSTSIPWTCHAERSAMHLETKYSFKVEEKLHLFIT